jgi:Rrf2 family protein
MLSKTSEYAIRAMVYIAQQGDKAPVLARDVAEKTGVPANYASKILRDLAQRGVLSSTRGVGGGFRLASPPKKIHIRAIVSPFESALRQNQCPFGMQVCTQDVPCRGHDHYKYVKEAYDTFLDDTTLYDVSLCPEQSNKRKSKRKKKAKR